MLRPSKRKQANRENLVSANKKRKLSSTSLDPIVANDKNESSGEQVETENTEDHTVCPDVETIDQTTNEAGVGMIAPPIFVDTGVAALVHHEAVAQGAEVELSTPNALDEPDEGE
ncbi:hypothetical protein FRC10_005486 [Ceratobasidium sp. 414]|nr:hypothetical protein FRC10_005486 [Ceratobasidium sp. 414]